MLPSVRVHDRKSKEDLDLAYREEEGGVVVPIVALVGDAEVNLVNGTEVGLVEGTEVALVTGTQVALVTGTEVDLVSGAEVDLAAGAQVALVAGTEVLIHGGSDILTLTPTLSVGGAYTSGDFVGTSDTPLQFDLTTNGTKGLVQSVMVIDGDKNAKNLELWLFDESPTLPNDNAVYDVSDAHAKYAFAVIPITKWYLSNSNAEGFEPGLGIPFKCLSNSHIIYGALITRGDSPSYTSGSLSIRVGFLKD